MKKSATRTLVECAMMIALSTVLSMVTLFRMPQGGSVTAASMVPLVLVSYRHGVRWGLLTGFVHSLLQMALSFSPPPAATFPAFAGVVLLDYVLAFTVLGLAAFFGGRVKNLAVSGAVGAIAVSFLRFVCSFLSGVLVWNSFAPEGVPVWYYSLGYNGSYMLPEGLITAAVTAALLPALERIRLKAAR